MIQTERLTIRRVEAGDWESILAMWQDFTASEMAQYDKPHDDTPEQAQVRIARWADCRDSMEHLFFAICLAQTVIGYAAFNIRPNGYELGYCFHSQYHGKGYASESLRALLTHMKQLGAANIFAGTAMNNTASVRLLQRLGFTLERTCDVSFYQDEAGNPITFLGGEFACALRKKTAVVYIHGKGGNAEEADRYASLLPDADVIGFDYQSATPWEAKEEFPAYVRRLQNDYAQVDVIANSIGAFFTMYALADCGIHRAWLISPVVDMEQLIGNMLRWAGATEQELAQRGSIETASGEVLSWQYLSYVRQNPLRWNVPTAILYGSCDALTDRQTIQGFADRIGATLTVMEGGEHWFHTPEQLQFLDRWLRRTAYIDTLHIAPAVPEDAEELLDYLRRIGGETDNLSFGAEGLPFSAEDEQRYIASLADSQNSVMLVVRRDGRIVANGSFTGIARERMKHRGELAISVCRAEWGKGVGSALMEALLRFAKDTAKAEIVSLEVRSDNVRAIRLYERFGFEKIGTYRGFVKIRGKLYDADLMNLYLK